MIKPIFKKKLYARGRYGEVTAEVITTMNYDLKYVTGTNASTSETYSRNVPLHKVECFVDGKLWKSVEGIETEWMVFNESETRIRETKKHIEKLSDEEPVKTFAEKMSELFECPPVVPEW